MFEKILARVLRSRFAVAATALGTLLIAVGTGAGAAQDKYTLQVPNGLPFSDFKGYEDWQVVAVSQTDALLKVMVANPTMIAAYKAGIPGNGKPFPDGSKIAKIEWKPKKSTEAPFDVRIPESLQDVFFIEKDSKRFPDTKGWAYAVFDSKKIADLAFEQSLNESPERCWLHTERGTGKNPPRRPRLYPQLCPRAVSFSDGQLQSCFPV